MNTEIKPRVAVHKFASCDGCQLAFLNAGEELLNLATMVEFVHFAEAGPVDPDAKVDIAFIEGSITTPHDIDRINRIRTNSQQLITIGACATAGGIQALRNYADTEEWTDAVYAQPEYIQTLSTSTPIKEHVKVDFEIWGCPVNAHQVMLVIHDLLSGVTPHIRQEKVCLECKRQQNICVMVTQGTPCMGPVTQTGCGAICPHVGRDCYACFGPAENSNTQSLGQRFEGLGLLPKDIARRFQFINTGASLYKDAAAKWSIKK
jgi:coenzyme F420-reducing hydrogenase gamma subunit